jgi:hypothetical protein
MVATSAAQRSPRGTTRELVQPDRPDLRASSDGRRVTSRRAHAAHRHETGSGPAQCHCPACCAGQMMRCGAPAHDQAASCGDPRRRVDAVRPAGASGQPPPAPRPDRQGQPFGGMSRHRRRQPAFICTRRSTGECPAHCRSLQVRPQPLARRAYRRVGALADGHVPYKLTVANRADLEGCRQQITSRFRHAAGGSPGRRQIEDAARTSRSCLSAYSLGWVRRRPWR